MAGSATILMLPGLVMALARNVPTLAGFVVPFAGAVGPLVADIVIAIVRRRARDQGVVLSAGSPVIARLDRGREAEKSHERADDKGLTHCLSSVVSIWQGIRPGRGEACAPAADRWLLIHVSNLSGRLGHFEN